METVVRTSSPKMLIPQLHYIQLFTVKTRVAHEPLGSSLTAANTQDKEPLFMQEAPKHPQITEERSLPRGFNH